MGDADLAVCAYGLTVNVKYGNPTGLTSDI
jgi:hypothetical protein